MSNEPTPIFLISLPRSGSTFLQKILMSHADIASTAEPWFLLPLCFMRRKQGVYARYGHTQSVNAFTRISKDCGESFIDARTADFARSIYARYCGAGERYFLDKTPRYYHILEDLVRIFPGARFVVLLRNPVSVFASSIQAFRGNTVRRLDHLETDFIEGPRRIGEFVQRHGEQLTVLTYERLVTDPQGAVSELCDYLQIPYADSLVSDSFDIDLKGHGDHLGARTLRAVESGADKWRDTIDTAYRKRRLLSYLANYPQVYLEAGGYDRGELLDLVQSHPVRRRDLKEYLFALEERLITLYKAPQRGRYGQA